MINVGFYYKVKKGHEQEFESKFKEVLNYLKSNAEGFIDAKLYKSVEDPSEYLIYSVWKDLESFRKFITSEAYKSTVTYGRTIMEGRPTHKVFQEINA
ncbi:MAG: antibiotic biosynthesis monooxygenase [Saccharolobus sp.]|jgi:heme-degrading monooxygenase HmoA|uniref:Antibiotic biosynthesis monooxygenase n=1 Tax=Saccharolobus caldissimus TaxID=1702097 RepID=A0AAQ4CSE0_9CREN|nr:MULTISPECIES: antibiotic biosynthesis monooxygenase [Saccharolobus]MDT7862513.1 antibiotic biosynthesis monooxygenase [Saccharolobus sp.]BDB98721.1 antibiotic biosynthesis monooxygenase [Saccharolobus caldissimus]